VLFAEAGFVAYVTNTVFPDPLSEAEEAGFVEGLLRGDQEARSVLIERNLRLVAHIAKKFEGTGEDPDDLISIGTIGLIKAVNTFDPSKGTKLATYAAKCIENEILMYLRALKKSAHEVSLFDPIGVDKEGNEVTLVDILGTDPEAVAETVERDYEYERVKRHLARLDAREREVLELRYGILGSVRRTQREIARKLGISRSYVSRIEKKAIRKLISELEKSSSAWLG